MIFQSAIRGRTVTKKNGLDTGSKGKKSVELTGEYSKCEIQDRERERTMGDVADQMGFERGCLTRWALVKERMIHVC